MNSQKGFAPFTLIVIVVVILSAGAGIFVFLGSPESVSPIIDEGQVSEKLEEIEETPNEVVETIPEEIIKDEVPNVPTQTENSLLTILEGEIDRLIEDGLLIDFGHHEKLRARLDALVGTEDKGVIARVDEKLIFLIEPEEQEDADDPTALLFNPEWGDCEDKEVKFSVSPIDPKVIELIEPTGRMAPSHPLPTTHMYISDDIGWENTGGLTTTYDVVAPADGLIVGIGAFPNSVNDYSISIWYSCSLTSYFLHLADPAPEILAITGELPPGSGWDAFNQNAIPVKAGQRIARSKGTFDFGVADSNVVLTGFVIPEHYATQIHIADPFDYFIEPVRSQMLEKNPRTVEPVGGKIDYDIDGRLVGNWFQEGLVGYGDSGAPDFTTKGWLAIAYDFINPARVLISFGAEDEIGITEEDCRCGWVYGVKGNKPDPALVSVDTGLLKYELLGSEHITDSRGFRVWVNTDQVLGVFLVQMLDDRTIKGEVFPKKTALQVTGFTNAAKIYKR